MFVCFPFKIIINNYLFKTNIIRSKKYVNTNNGQIVTYKFKNNQENFSSSNNSINQTDNNNNYGEDFDNLLKSEKFVLILALNLCYN